MLTTVKSILFIEVHYLSQSLMSQNCFYIQFNSTSYQTCNKTNFLGDGQQPNEEKFTINNGLVPSKKKHQNFAMLVIIQK